MKIKEKVNVAHCCSKIHLHRVANKQSHHTEMSDKLGKAKNANKDKPLYGKNLKTSKLKRHTGAQGRIIFFPIRLRTFADCHHTKS